ncbi:Iron hydrogenase, subset [Parasponia andersonii]|uniref:Iron hydrogenase, subset n=1 Tax=Parasponia andersonii TaxID=3476 RepID=A0A2P5ABX9_PARAD|nr:Iron hydrogenase, subset [Parasponia andersonii]
MSEKFSPSLRIGDLSDFIAPSQACIVSLKGLKASARKPSDSKPELRNVMSAVPSLWVPNDMVFVSLTFNGGCVTSAETIMLEKQSLDEFLSNISKGKFVIVSLSPQSRASLAVHFGISPLQVLKKLTTFFKLLGVKAVFDTSCSRDLTIIESCNEFITRYKQSQLVDDEKNKYSLPMISSACPGWICYAEKQLGSYILPYISSVKSPQQTIGAIVKIHICQKMGLRPDEIYHVTVMPCYDKKLEAARDDFVFQVESQAKTNENEAVMITEVDSVLTSGEVLELIQLKGVDFKNLKDSPLDTMLTNVTEEGHIYGVPGSSGGYGETIFRYAAKVLFGRTTEGPLEFRTIRNSDFQEVTLELVVYVAIIDIVLVLNVGCLNGGGQVKPKPGQSGKDLIQSLETVYMENVLVADPFKNPLIRRLYDEWLEQPGSEKAKRHMHTEYHPVVKSITSQLSNW